MEESTEYVGLGRFILNKISARYQKELKQAIEAIITAVLNAAKDLGQTSVDTKKNIKHKIDGVISCARPIEYFRSHPMYSMIVPVAEESVGIKRVPIFIELAIYSHFCTHALGEYVACVQAYWVDEAIGEAILDDEILVKFCELCYVVNWIFEPNHKAYEIKVNDESNKNKYISIGCYRFKEKPSKENVFPNEFYYREKYSCTKTMGKYHALSLLVINDMVKSYEAYFDKNPERHSTDIFKSLEPVCSDIDRSGNEFTLTSPYITKYKNSPLTLVFLISLAKASGDMVIANNAILSALPIEYIEAFRDLFWFCDKYLEYNLVTLYPRENSISECITLYNSDYEFEEGAYIPETPTDEYLNFQDAINTTSSCEILDDEDVNDKFSLPVNVKDLYIMPLCKFVATELLANVSIKELPVIKYVFWGRGKKLPYATKLVFKKGKKGRLVYFVKIICHHADISSEKWSTLNEWIIEENSTGKYLSEINPTSNYKSKQQKTYSKELFASLKKNTSYTDKQICEDLALELSACDSEN